MNELRFTADDYWLMAKHGILGKEDHCELVEGLIFWLDMRPMTHSIVHSRFIKLSGTCDREKERFPLSNASVRFGFDSVLECDLLFLKEWPMIEEGFFDSASLVCHLVVEIALTSKEWDVNTKLPIYAAAGIPEVWVVDIPGKKIDVFRNPNSPARHYGEITSHASGRIAPKLDPAIEIDIQKLFDGLRDEYNIPEIAAELHKRIWPARNYWDAEMAGEEQEATFHREQQKAAARYDRLPSCFP